MPRNTLIFREKWQLDCGVRILTRNTVTNEVESIVCMFCKTYGKEEPEDADKRKRKRSQNVSKYTAPWRTDLIKNHNKSMHPKKWKDYQMCSVVEREKVFYDGDDSSSKNNGGGGVLPSPLKKKSPVVMNDNKIKNQGASAAEAIDLTSKKVVDEEQMIIRLHQDGVDTQRSALIHVSEIFKNKRNRADNLMEMWRAAVASAESSSNSDATVKTVADSLQQRYISAEEDLKEYEEHYDKCVKDIQVHADILISLSESKRLQVRAIADRIENNVAKEALKEAVPTVNEDYFTFSTVHGN